MLHILLFIFFLDYCFTVKCIGWIHPLQDNTFKLHTNVLCWKIIKSVPYKRFPIYCFSHSAAGHSWSSCSCICACVFLINQDTAWEVLILYCIFMHGRVIWSIFFLSFRPLKRHTMESAYVRVLYNWQQRLLKWPDETLIKPPRRPEVYKIQLNVKKYPSPFKYNGSNYIKHGTNNLWQGKG